MLDCRIITLLNIAAHILSYFQLNTVYNHRPKNIQKSPERLVIEALIVASFNDAYL